MKSQLDFDEITTFLSTSHNAEPGSVKAITEGRIAQAVKFRANGVDLVCRFAPDEHAFQGDKIASDLELAVPVPTVLGVGSWSDVTWCISMFCPGTPGDQISVDAFGPVRNNVLSSLATIHQTETNSIAGFGWLSSVSQARFPTFDLELDARLARFSESLLSSDLVSLGMNPALAGRLHEIVARSRIDLPENRCLIHGDPLFDNVLIQSGEVAAHIDWAQIGIGDWVQDFVRLELWDPDRYGRAEDYGREYDLDTSMLDQRRTLYGALTLMDAIHFDVAYANQEEATWVRLEAERLVGEWE